MFIDADKKLVAEIKISINCTSHDRN